MQLQQTRWCVNTLYIRYICISEGIFRINFCSDGAVLLALYTPYTRNMVSPLSFYSEINIVTIPPLKP